MFEETIVVIAISILPSERTRGHFFQVEKVEIITIGIFHAKAFKSMFADNCMSRFVQFFLIHQMRHLI